MTLINGSSFGSPYVNRADNYANQFTRGANGMLQTNTLSGSAVDSVTIHQDIGTGHAVSAGQDQDRLARLERKLERLANNQGNKNSSLQELMLMKELLKDDKKDKPSFLEKALDPAGIFTGKKEGGGLLGGLFG
jgi:TolA-binding protein